MNTLPNSWLVRTSLMLWTLLVPAYGETALYCVVDFGGKRCQFSDLTSCQKAAGKHGNCFLNREVMLAPHGGSPFCLVESWHTACVYRSLASCNVVAKPRQAICIPNPNLTAAPVADDTKKIPGGKTPEKSLYFPSPEYQPSPGHR